MPHLVLTWALLAASTFALAEKDPAARLLDEQRQQLRDESLGQPSMSRVPIAGRPSLDANPADVAESGPTIPKPRINIDEFGLISRETLDSTIGPFRVLPLGENRLELLLRQLDARLVEAGYVTSHALLESASIDTGEVRIRVLPGRLDDIRIGGDTAAAGIVRAFPMALGEVLQLADVEQGIHQINRLRLYQAQVTLRPGDSPGGSYLDLALGTGKPWRASLGADNQGSVATGQNRVRAGFGFDDAFGMLDSLQIQALASSNSRAGLASFAVPQGYAIWSLTASGSRSTQRLPAGLELRSDAWTGLAGWNRVLTLAAEGRDSIDLSIARSRYARSIDGTALDADRLTVLRAAISHVRNSATAHWYVEPALSAGVPWLGAQRDPADLERASAHAQFVKLALNAGAVATFAQGDLETAIQAGGQFARVGLHGSEQLSLGGLSSVRGFREGVLTGDRGFLWRGEVRLPRVLANLPVAGQAVPYLHLDYGAAWLARADGDYVAGAGVGARWSGRGAVFEAVASHPVAGPAALREGLRVHFSLAIEI